jgi:hypothetical protein
MTDPDPQHNYFVIVDRGIFWNALSWKGNLPMAKNIFLWRICDFIFDKLCKCTFNKYVISKKRFVNVLKFTDENSRIIIQIQIQRYGYPDSYKNFMDPQHSLLVLYSQLASVVDPDPVGLASFFVSGSRVCRFGTVSITTKSKVKQYFFRKV